MTFVEQPVDQGDGILLVIARGVGLGDRDGLDEIMLDGLELFPVRNSRADRHFFVNLSGIARDYRGTIFQGLSDAELGLPHGRRPEYNDEPARHDLEVQVLGAVENFLAVLVVVFLVLVVVILAFLISGGSKFPEPVRFLARKVAL